MEQVDEDAAHAFGCALNCLRFEAEGADQLNVGSADEPRLLPRAEAWQHAYAMWVVVGCDGDRGRVVAAAERCREKARGTPAGSHKVRTLSRAADLCDQAAGMIEGAGAVGDDKARRRLLASCEHQTRVIAIGVLPGVAEDSARRLAEMLREIDEEH
jgi:hypothetical protein